MLQLVGVGSCRRDGLTTQLFAFLDKSSALMHNDFMTHNGFVPTEAQRGQRICSRDCITFNTRQIASSANRTIT